MYSNILNQNYSLCIQIHSECTAVEPIYTLFTSTHDFFQGQNLIMSSSMINVGRYWPYVGPQVRLYVPKPFLAPSPTINYIIMFELEQAPCDTSDKCTVEFVDQALINAAPHKPNFEREETVFSRKRISV